MEKIRVLFLAASPQVAELSLDREVREIRAKIRAADYRDYLEVIDWRAVRPGDLTQALLQHRPHVLHFSGHGTASEELVLLDGNASPQPVPKETLAELLRQLKDNLRLVVLNACFSRPLAEAIAGEIDCAVGMNHAVGDEVAIKFAAAFYLALGFDRSIDSAFQLGKLALSFDGPPEDELLRYLSLDPAGGSFPRHPESPAGVTPQLVARPGIDQKQVYLLRATSTPLNPNHPPPKSPAIDYYLQRLAHETAHLTLLGLGRSLQVELPIRDAYVPLRAKLAQSFESKPTDREYAGHAEFEKEVELSDVFHEAAARERRAVILLGEPGSGKTTGARQLAWRLANGKTPPEQLGLPPYMTPVLLRFRNLPPRAIESPHGLRTVAGWIRQADHAVATWRSRKICGAVK